MSLDMLQKAFVELVDGLWWGLRENVGALSMYEGYIRGFRQMGEAAARKAGVKGAEDAARIAHEIFVAFGMTTKLQGKEIHVKRCPLWNRILEKGLEYSFHIEEICWKPMLEGIGDKMGAKAIVETSLRLAHVERARLEHKKTKRKRDLDRGKLSQQDYETEIAKLEEKLKPISEVGRYRFE